MRNLFFIYLCLINLLLFSSCKVKTAIPQKSLFNENLVIEFKNVGFHKCIEHGFGKSIAINNLLKEDRSYSQDYILGQDNYRLLDTLAMHLALRIKQDSIKVNRPFQSNLEEYRDMIGKRVFMVCLEYYTSPELDSIAKVRTSKAYLPFLYKK